MDFEQGYHEWMGKANLWWIKQSLSQVPRDKMSAVLIAYICLWNASKFGFFSVCLTSWHSSVCSCWSASDWCMRSKGHPSCSPGKNPHDVNRKRSKLQLAIGIMITCTIYSAHCLCCIVKILSSLYFILIAVKLLNTVPAFMIKDNMEKAL